MFTEEKLEHRIKINSCDSHGIDPVIPQNGILRKGADNLVSKGTNGFQC